MVMAIQQEVLVLVTEFDAKLKPEIAQQPSLFFFIYIYIYILSATDFFLYYNS